MWEWIITNKLLIASIALNFIGAFDRIATKTPDDFEIFGLKVGKYDDELAKVFIYIKDIVSAFFPGRNGK